MTGFQNTDWQQVGQLTFTGSTKNVLPAALSYRFNKRLIRVYTKTIATAQIKPKASWHRAGYLEQRYNGKILKQLTIPLNRDSIFALPLIDSHYSLTFTPVNWLPNLFIRFFIYRGNDSLVIDELKLH